MIVILVEIFRKNFLASMVPVIVNSVLNEHHVVTDIVAFVSKGDFPRSRLGEKQRGKILATWVTRKMRTIAQFSIRDPDGADSQLTEVAEENAAGARHLSMMQPPGGGNNGSIKRPSSLRKVTSASALPDPNMPPGFHAQQQQGGYGGYPPGIEEIPTPEGGHYMGGSEPPFLGEDALTPTAEHHQRAYPHLQAPPNGGSPGMFDYSPVDMVGAGVFDNGSYNNSGQNSIQPSRRPSLNVNNGGGGGIMPPDQQQQQQQAWQDQQWQQQQHDQSYQSSAYSYPQHQQQHQQLQSEDGGGSGGGSSSDLAPQPSYESKPFLNLPGGGEADSLAEVDSGRLGGGLRVANRNSVESSEEEWPQEALMHMSLRD